MSTDQSSSSDPFRERYQEVPAGSATLAMIDDPENGAAWILSSVSLAVKP